MTGAPSTPDSEQLTVPAAVFRHVLGTDARVSEHQVRQTPSGAHVLAVGSPDPAALTTAIAGALRRHGVAEPDVEITVVDRLGRHAATGKLRGSWRSNRTFRSVPGQGYIAAKLRYMAKTWVLDTDTKGTGARVVPIEHVSKQAEPKAPFVEARSKPGARAPSGPQSGSAEKKTERKLLTPLGPGQVRKKSTGEIGKVKSVDAKAGTATVQWLRGGLTSTVPLSSVTRR